MRPNRKNRRIWSHLLKKLLMENYFLCSVIYIPLISKAKFDNPLTVHDAITRYLQPHHQDCMGINTSFYDKLTSFFSFSS